MEKYLRFADLREMGLVKSWPMVRLRIKRDGFPEGVKLGPNVRAWRESEVAEWLANRPSDKKIPPRRPPDAAARAGRPRKAKAAASKAEPVVTA